MKISVNFKIHNIVKVKEKEERVKKVPSFLFDVEFDVSVPSPEAMLFWSLTVISFASMIPDDPDNERAGGKLDCIAATSFIQRSSACFFFHNSLKLMQASLHTLNIKTKLISKVKVSCQ